MCLLKGETLLRSGMVYIHLLLLCHLSVIVCLELPCRRKMLDSNDERTETEEVFTGGEEADMFLSRSLLYNRFDFEMFVPGNAERECFEEVCNYEEAREIFKDHATTTKFWREYSTKGPYAKPETVQKMDVTGLLTGLVATGAILIIFWFIGYYIYKYKCKTRRQRPGSTVNHARSQIRSSISRRLEHMFTPQHPPHPPPTTLNLEPPSYEEAVALNGSLETPPPSYPETIEEIQLFRKPISLPAGQSH